MPFDQNKVDENQKKLELAGFKDVKIIGNNYRPMIEMQDLQLYAQTVGLLGKREEISLEKLNEWIEGRTLENGKKGIGLNDVWGNDKTGKFENLQAAENIKPELDSAIVNTIYWARNFYESKQKIENMAKDGLSILELCDNHYPANVGMAQAYLKDKFNKSILIDGDKTLLKDLLSPEIKGEVELLNKFLSENKYSGLSFKGIEEAWTKYRTDHSDEIPKKAAVTRSTTAADESKGDVEVAATTERAAQPKAAVNTKQPLQFSKDTWDLQTALIKMGYDGKDDLGGFQSVDASGKAINGQNTGIDGKLGICTKGTLEKCKQEMEAKGIVFEDDAKFKAFLVELGNASGDLAVNLSDGINETELVTLNTKKENMGRT